MPIQEIFRRVGLLFSTVINNSKSSNNKVQNNNEIHNSTNTNTAPINAGGDVVFKQTTNYYYQSEIPKYLTSKPFKPDLFLSRTIDLESISNALANDNIIIILLNGEGGIGKTSLAAQFWFDNEANYKHLGWVYSEGSIQQSLLQMAQNAGKKFDEKMNDSERLQSFLSYLSNLKSPSLLVLDNVNDPQDIRKHYKQLNGLNNFKIIITSRINELANISTQKIVGLDLQTAIDLFKSYYNEISKAEDSLLETIFAAIDFNTLVIELLAKNLRELNKFKNGYSLNGLLNDLQQLGLLNVKTKSIETSYGSIELQSAKPEAVLRAMYDLTSLSNEQIDLLCNICVLPSESISYEQIKSLLVPINEDDFEIDIFVLHQKGWIDFNSTTKSFKCSPVIQAIVKDKNKDSLLAKCKTLISSLNEKFESHNQTQVRPYALFSVSVLDSLKVTSQETAVLSKNLSRYFKDAGNLAQAVIYNLLSTRVFEKTPNNYNLYECYAQLSDIRRTQGNYKEAERLSNINIQKLKGNNSDDAIYIKSLGKMDKALIDYVTGKSENALEVLKDANSAFQSLYRKNSRSLEALQALAASCLHLSEVLSSLGRDRLEEAFDYSRQAQKYFNILSQQHPTVEAYKKGTAIAYARHGMLLRDNAQTYEEAAQATDLIKKCYDLFRELNDNNPESEELIINLCRAQDLLGREYLKANNYRDASKFLKDNHELAKRVYQNNPQSEASQIGLAISNCRLGDLELKHGRVDDAIVHYVEYNRLNIKFNEQNPQSANIKGGLAVSYNILGNIQVDKSNDEAALEFFLHNNQHRIELNNIQKSELSLDDVAKSHASLGLTLRTLNRIDEAIFHISEAHKSWDQLCKKYRVEDYCKNARDMSSILNELSQ